jgi:hypothetical protein
MAQGPKHASSNVVGTPGLEYTSLDVSWIVLINSASVGVKPNALSSLAGLGLCGFDSSLSLSSSSSELSSSCPSLSFSSSLSFILHHPHFRLHHLGHLDLFVVVIVLAL